MSMEAKGSSTLRNPWGENEGGGEVLCPTLAKSQGCRAEKFLHTPRRSLRTAFIQPRDRTTSPRGNLQNTNQRRTKVVYEERGWVSLSAPPLTHPPSSGPGLTEAGEKGSDGTLGPHPLRGLPRGGWARLPRPTPPWPGPSRLSPSHNGAASPSSRSPACRIPL